MFQQTPLLYKLGDDTQLIAVDEVTLFNSEKFPRILGNLEEYITPSVNLKYNPDSEIQSASIQLLLGFAVEKLE